MTDKRIAARNACSTMRLHRDLGATGSEGASRSFEETEMAIAMAAETDPPIALRGFGGLFASICLCSAGQRRQWSCFPRMHGDLHQEQRYRSLDCRAQGRTNNARSRNSTRFAFLFTRDVTFIISS